MANLNISDLIKKTKTTTLNPTEKLIEISFSNDLKM